MQPILKKYASIFTSIILITVSVGMIFVHPTSGSTTESNEIRAESAIFENTSKANTHLAGWKIKGKGTLEDTEQGLLLTSEPKENVMPISNVTSEGFIYEAEVKVIDKNADATLVFRSNKDG